MGIDHENGLEISPELYTPMQKYNISLQDNPGRWDSYGVPVKISGVSREFHFLNGEDFYARNLSGAVAGRETLQIPEYPIHLGTEPVPTTIRALTYLGERMTDEQFRAYLLRHEIGHAAVNRDLAVVLQKAIAGHELEYLRTMSQLAAAARKTGAPLSMLYTLPAYRTDDDKFMEDLADMYAVKARASQEGEHIWAVYKKFVLKINPDLESLFGIVESLFEESQNPSYR